MRRALISIHDVMPDTLDHVARILDELGHRGLNPTTLLVVPGLAWDEAGRARLRAWQAAGHELAAHGWSHRARAPRDLKHRLHAALISRDCGEHLSQSRSELRTLLSRSHAWFAGQGLGAPRLYVPPAWALGALRPTDLAASPFELVESTGGVRHTPSGRFRRLPVLGYEADAQWRAAALHAVNATARAGAALGRLPRLSIHPHDLELHLRRNLLHTLDQITEPAHYGELFAAVGAED